MYIRVKRSKTTYFIQCEPTETILDIKQKLQNLVDQPVNDQRLILVSTGEVLDDSKTLADQKVPNKHDMSISCLSYFLSHFEFMYSSLQLYSSSVN